MVGVDVHHLASCITCHAWNPDQSMVAVCPNNNELHIYRVSSSSSSEKLWEKLHILREHDQLISGIDWAVTTNRIVTVSHDRNSYVWNPNGNEWNPALVILRLNRAALCVQWSPQENKFAVGSGAKIVCVCHFEKEQNWWVSKHIRKKHNSSVTGVAWHPNNVFLATTSCDGKCRIFSTYIKGVDLRDSGGTASSEAKFGEQILQLDLSFSWSFGVKWSPSGNSLAYVGHNSMIHFVDEAVSAASAQTVPFRDLPLRDVLFISERTVVGVGYDCNPMVFTADERGIWSFVKFLDERKATPSTSKYGLQALGKLYGQSRTTISPDSVEPTKPRGGAHENCINCIVPLKKAGEANLKRFSTSGMDGKVVVWKLGKDEVFL